MSSALRVAHVGLEFKKKKKDRASDLQSPDMNWKQQWSFL